MSLSVFLLSLDSEREAEAQGRKVERSDRRYVSASPRQEGFAGGRSELFDRTARSGQKVHTDQPRTQLLSALVFRLINARYEREQLWQAALG